MKRVLIVVAKKPTPGQTKTRLSPPLSQEEAVELYRCFLLDTLDMMTQVDGIERIIAYSPPTAELYFRRVAPAGFSFVPQNGQTLGERLDNVLTDYLNRGNDQVVVMNSDAPTLPVVRLQQAFQQLDDPEVGVVLGPSDDGGYYLIGLKRPCSDLFKVVMSTPTVLHETVALANEQNLRTVCLDPWYDIDTPQDLDRLIAELQSLSHHDAVRTRGFLSQLRAPFEGRF